MFKGCSGQELTGTSRLLDTDSVTTAIQSVSGAVTKIKPSGFKDYGVVHTQADIELVCCEDFTLLRWLVLAAVMDKH